MSDDRFNSLSRRDRIEAHRQEGSPQKLAQQATTPGMRERLEEQAREHWRLAAEAGITPED